MDAFAPARLAAASFRAEVLERVEGEATAQAVLAAASSLTGVVRHALPAGDPALCKAEAVLDRDVPAIFYKATTPKAEAAFHQAHEFGHFRMEAEPASACAGGDLDVGASEERLPFGVQRVEGYGPRERRECAANVFAREFLLPAAEARQLFLDERLGAAEIAARKGLTLALVREQLGRGLLLPETAPVAEAVHEPRQAPPPDASQRLAAEWPQGPFLLEAGPGTGKTRTLVARVLWLGQVQQVDPGQILALTFSNKAAEELRERITAAWPDGGRAWTGTFHGFGLEVLRRYGDRLGLAANVPLLDPNGALELLEDALPSLPLHHYLKLYEPSLALSDILKAISRAKDELVSPEAYRQLAEAMRQRAGDDGDAIEAAERALEVAGIYAAYEAALRREGIVDFGDLIGRTQHLLEADAEVRAALQARYRHILVDEYQDMNRASGRMLKSLAGNGRGLWVVGDARQSIYRFRGASPQNIRGFETDFPGAARRALSTNYRSRGPIVRAFEAFAPSMKASVGGLPAAWTPDRGEEGPPVALEIAVDREAEAAGLAATIRARVAEGIPFREQAILCRSHTNLARYAQLLEALEIPVLYLGDLFERPEVRDLLALISLAGEPHGGGLVRVAQFAEYAVPLGDLRRVLDHMHAQGQGGIEVLDEVEELGLTAAGRAGLARLRADVAGAGAQGPAELLQTFLFEGGGYLRRLMAVGGVAGQQQRIAVFQLLQVAGERRPLRGAEPKRAFLDWVRRLEIFGEERQLRAPPAAAGAIDAVRLLTVHASKGLEFRAVYLPGLARSMFPSSAQYDPCPPPAGLVEQSNGQTHLEEEECLFFVALSRARDVLCLSRALRYGSVNRQPSDFLSQLAGRLPRAPDGPPSWTAHGPQAPPDRVFPELARSLAEHRSEDLDQHKRCGRTYLYQRILGLHGGREDNGYVRFHRSVYEALRVLPGLPHDAPLAKAALRAALEEAWARIGPKGHPLEALYHREALAILEKAQARWRNAVQESVDWRVQRGAATIRVVPDMVERVGGVLVARRLRTGRPPKKAPDDDVYALYHEASGRAATVEALFLGADHAAPVPMTSTVVANRLAKYDTAIAQIAEGRFPASPDDRSCPRCPHYFICPAVVADEG